MYGEYSCYRHMIEGSHWDSLRRRSLSLITPNSHRPHCTPYSPEDIPILRLLHRSPLLFPNFKQCPNFHPKLYHTEVEHEPVPTAVETDPQYWRGMRSYGDERVGLMSCSWRIWPHPRRSLAKKVKKRFPISVLGLKTKPWILILCIYNSEFIFECFAMLDTCFHLMFTRLTSTRGFIPAMQCSCLETFAYIE